MPINRNKKLVSKAVDYLSVEWSTLGAVLGSVQALIDLYGKDATIHKRLRDYSDETYLAVVTEVPETDVEQATRIAREERREREQDDRDKAAYERYIAKHGK